MVIASCLASVFVAVFAAVFAAVSSSVAAPPAEMLFIPGTEMTYGLETLPDPLRAFDQYADTKKFSAAAVQSTAGCSNFEVWEPVLVSRAHWRTIAPAASSASGWGVLAIAAELNCIKLGQPAHVAELDRLTGITTTLGWFLPTGIADRRAQYSDQEEALLVSAGLVTYRRPIVFVTGRVITSYLSDGDGRYAPRMSGIRIVDRKQMESAIQDKAQIVDVRTAKQFAAAHVKNSVNATYTTGPRMKTFDAYPSYAKAGDTFDLRKVDPDRQKPVILLGSGPYSDNVYRAANTLRSLGWKNIFIFYEGFDYFAQMLWKPPAASGILETINRPEVLSRLRSGANINLVDVRTDVEFLDGRVAGSVLATYKERDDLRIHRPSLNGHVLKLYGDSWTPPAGIDKTAPTVIIGRDEYDWRSYKAALVAKALGFQSVYWYRVGVESWKLVGADQPALYPVTRPGKN